MNVYDIFGSGRKPAVTESKIEVVHEYVNEDFSGLMFGANNEDIAGPGGSDNNDSTSPIHGFGEDYDNIPDLENVGEQVVSIMDAERRLAQGDRIFAFHEMDEEPSEIHDVGQLAGYDAEQLLAVPQGVAEGKEDKIAQLKKDYATAVHWSKNETSPQKREAARQKAEKIKSHLEKQYKQGVAEGLPQTLRKVVPGYAKREIDRKMDAGKFGKTDADKDANFQRYKKIQDKLKEQGVAEGIFDRFKKKPAQPEVSDPGNYPRIGSDIAQWMADTVEYHKSKFPDSVWKLFCPTYPDYLPVRVRVGTSEKTMHQHLDDYINLRNQNPEAVRVARQKFDKNNTYPSGPREDYTNKVSEQGVAEGTFDNASPMTKDIVKTDRIRSLKNLIALAKEQGRQLRVQELELELKKLQGVAEGFDYTMKDLGNDYTGFPSNHSMKHKMLKRIKPEKHQIYKDKMNNMHEFDDLLKLFKVAQARGDVIEQGVAEAPHDDEVDYDDKYQAMVKRVGQKAREQQRHEPVDLVKLAQRLRQADKTTDTTDEDVMESRLSAMKRAGYDIL